MSKCQWMMGAVLLGALLPVNASETHNSHEQTAANRHNTHGAVHWEYEGAAGPQSWGRLSHAYAACGEGKNQSPIDIQSHAGYELDILDIAYGTAPLNVINNGHTIQFNYQQQGTLRVGDAEYGLAQFHFHAPSEHKINGKHADMEVHFVHKGQDGRLAVVGIMINRGRHNQTLDSVWGNMPVVSGSKARDQQAFINVQDILPENREYYYYNGSLTTPPCSEGVRWFVMKEPVEMSESQIDKFMTTIKANARPVQPVGSRVVRGSI